MENLKLSFEQILRDTKISSDLIERIKKDITPMESGHYVYWPAGPRGYLDEYHLILIAAILHDMNKEWDAEIAKYFEEHPVSGCGDDDTQQGA